MSLIFRPAAISDVGLRRANNEDAAHASRRLLAVADGIGGLPAGEVASDLVIQALIEVDRDAPADLAPKRALTTLQKTVSAANRQIKKLAAADPAREGMGTTLSALLLAGDQAALVHVGDSRAYLLRSGTLTQLTRDDTLVQALVDAGELTPAEARRHPQRSLVMRALQGADVPVAGSLLPVRRGDRYLVCSDGLSDFVADDDIAPALLYPEPNTCAERLVKLAVQAGAPDNVTVVVADVEESGKSAP